MVARDPVVDRSLSGAARDSNVLDLIVRPVLDLDAGHADKVVPKTTRIRPRSVLLYDHGRSEAPMLMRHQALGAFPSGSLVLGHASGSCPVRRWMASLVEASS